MNSTHAEFPDRDPEWLEYICSLRCIVCGSNRRKRIPHHIRRFSRTQGTSKKPPDFHAIPVCQVPCHDALHHGYGELWTQVLEAWVPLMIEYFTRRHSVEEAF